MSKFTCEKGVDLEKLWSELEFKLKIEGKVMDEVFVCDVCESTENVQSPIWDECCAYCALSMHEANIEIIKAAIAKAEEES